MPRVRNVSPDTWLKGTVARLAPFGAFVTVTAPGGASADGRWVQPKMAGPRV